MIICCLISQCFIWWPSEKSLGEHRDPISEAIKQSSDWDHSTNPPYLFSKLSPGPLSWFPPNLTATRAVHPWPLQRMSSCRWPRHLDEATDLFFALNDRPWESPARLHPSMATTWRPVGPVPLLLPPPSCSLYKALVQASSELLMLLLLSPVSRWSNRPGDVTSYCSCATSCCALAVRFKIGRQNPGKCAAGWWNFWSSSTISLHYRSRAHHILRKEERKNRERKHWCWCFRIQTGTIGLLLEHGFCFSHVPRDQTILYEARAFSWLLCRVATRLVQKIQVSRYRRLVSQYIVWCGVWSVSLIIRG